MLDDRERQSCSYFVSSPWRERWPNPTTVSLTRKRETMIQDRLRDGTGTTHYFNEFKSAGPEELHSGVVMELVDMISESLFVIFENCWRMGEVPKTWR